MRGRPGAAQSQERVGGGMISLRNGRSVALILTALRAADRLGALEVGLLAKVRALVPQLVLPSLSLSPPRAVHPSSSTAGAPAVHKLTMRAKCALKSRASQRSGWTSLGMSGAFIGLTLQGLSQ